MSDIFVKAASSGGYGTTGWRKASRIWAKTANSPSTGWREATGVWIRNATQWLKVWPISGIFASRVPFIADFSSDAYAARLTTASRLRIGTSYFGDNAVWDLNGFAASNYTYKWKLYDQYGSDLTTVLRSGTGSGWTSSAGEDQLPSSIWTATNSTNSDEQYLGFECMANASNGSVYSGLSVSSKIKVIRQSPVNSTYSLSSLTPVVGTQLTYSSTWWTGEAYKARTTTIQWYRNSTNSTTGGTPLTTGSTYTPVSADVGKYIYVTETRVNSGSDFDYGVDVGVSVSIITTSVVTEISNQATGSKRRVLLNSNFTSGTTVYVSTNGFISIGYDPASSIGVPASGAHLTILRGDHAQTALYHYSDATNFYVRWQGYRLNNTGRTIDYQAKFTYGSSAVDVYFVTNNLITADYDTNAVYNGDTATATWAGSTLQASTLLAVAGMTRNTSKDNVDDGSTAIVASVPLPAPTIIYLGDPVVSRTSNTYSYSTTTGSWNNAPTSSTSYSYQWYASTSLAYPPYVSTVTVGTNSSTYTSSSSYHNYSIYCTVTATNATGSSSPASSNSIQNTSPTYTITYLKNDGSGTAQGTSTFTYGGSTVAASAPTRAGYAFNGWYDTGNLDHSYYAAGGGTWSPPEGSRNMYGRWTAVAVATKLGTPTGVTASRTFTDKIRISWSAVSNASTYGVWYRGAAPVYTSAPDFATTSSLFLDDTSVSSGAERQYDVQAYPASGSTLYLKSDWGGPSNAGLRAVGSVTPATAPSQPGTPTNGWTGGTTYPFSWTASTSAGTVAGGGAATITKYGISIYEASSSSGSGAVWKGSFYTANGSTLSYTYTSPNASLYYAASVWAVNSANIESTASPLSAFK